MDQIVSVDINVRHHAGLCRARSALLELGAPEELDRYPVLLKEHLK